MPDRVIRLPSPLPHQRDFLLSPARYKVLDAGRKWGKTECCIIPVVDGHGPKKEMLGAAHGARGLWAAPTNDIARDIWFELKAATCNAWLEKHEVERLILLPGGGSVTVRSADNPDSLRGPNYDFVVMDEAAMLREDTWELVLEPTLAAPPGGRPGWAIFISTPKGTENWFRRLFDDAAKKSGWARWQRPSSDNPVISRAFLEEKKATVSSYTWRQEYLAEFVSAEGGIFKRQDARYYRIEDEDYVFPHDGTITTARDMQRFVTVDTATSMKTSADHTAIAAWGLDARGRLVLLDLDLSKIEGGEIMRRIVAMCRRWECMAWIEENATSKHLLSFMEEEGVVFRTVSAGTKDKWTRAQEAVARWERGMVVIPEHASWLAAFERQVYNFEPDGSDDDSVDALAYAARIVREELSPASQVGIFSGTLTKKVYLPSGYETTRPPGL